VYAKNYPNKARFDKVVTKIKWYSFLTHSVEISLNVIESVTVRRVG